MAKSRHRYWADQLQAISSELSKLAIACDIDFYRPDAVSRILRNDATICGRSNPRAFEEIRHHLMALYPLEERAIERIGAEETQTILDEIRHAIAVLRNAGRPGSAPDD
jgi:hypothetical protein